MDENLRRLENQSIFIIRETYRQFKKPAILWSMGKDSSLIIHLCKKAFFGKVPFPVVHLDTTYKFPEMIKFRDDMAKEWGLNLIVYSNEDATATPEGSTKMDCCTQRKTLALKQVMKKYGFDAVLVGIRRDEHGVRNKEHFMSPRSKDGNWIVVTDKKNKGEGDSDYDNQQEVELSGWGLFATEFKDADHVRVHPILNFSEREVWEYTREENIPIVPLYLAKNGKRYRSIGCMPCTQPVDSDADSLQKIVDELKISKTGERDGRAQDKENATIMQDLRSLGYL
jgi:sulfate adenylyltransferase subunit 2